jgi:hypothetical protein
MPGMSESNPCCTYLISLAKFDGEPTDLDVRCHVRGRDELFLASVWDHCFQCTSFVVATRKPCRNRPRRRRAAWAQFRVCWTSPTARCSAESDCLWHWTYVSSSCCAYPPIVAVGLYEGFQVIHEEFLNFIWKRALSQRFMRIFLNLKRRWPQTSKNRKNMTK